MDGQQTHEKKFNIINNYGNLIKISMISTHTSNNRTYEKHWEQPVLVGM